MKLKKIMALLMAVAMMAGVVACGGAKTDNNNGGKKSEYDWSAGATADGGEVTLKVATWRKNDRPYYEEIIKRFEKKYDWIKVELDITPDSSSYYSNLQADIMSGEAPDVFDSHPNTRLKTYAEEGIIAPQTDFDYMKSYSEDAKTVTTLEDGENYGYMNAYNYFGFLYNKKVFEKEGAEIPKTPEEFVALANQFKAAGYGGVILAGKTYDSAAIANQMFLLTMGSKGFDDMQNDIDSGKVTDITEIEGVESAFETMQLYADNDIWYQAYEGIDYESGLSLYAQQKSPIAYSGSYIFGEQSTYFPDIETGFFPMPTYANSGRTFAEGAQTSLIYAQGKNLGAAKLWVEFLATPEISEYFCSNAKMLSTIEGVTAQFDEAEMLMAAAPNGYAMKKITEPDNSEYWMSAFGKIFENIFFNDGDWKKLVKKFTSQLEGYDLGNL